MDGTLALKKYNVVERIKALEDAGGYVLPVASENTLGGVKIGENLSIDENGVLSAEGGGDDYTAAEQVVGTWMGEPLYRKSYYNASYSSGEVDLGISNVKAVVKIEGTAQIRFIEDQFDSFIPLPYINGNVNYENKFQMGPVTQTGNVRMNIGSNYTVLLPVKLYFTVWYTKESVSETKKKTKK